jgi:hypothetical protein
MDARDQHVPGNPRSIGGRCREIIDVDYRKARIDIAFHPLAGYVPQMRSRFGDDEWTAMHELHPLPPEWPAMSYGTFLEERRRPMAGVIQRSWEAR